MKHNEYYLYYKAERAKNEPQDEMELRHMDSFIEGYETALNLFNVSKCILDEKKPTRYRCLLCGRDTFTSKTSHYCVGGYRKHKIKWQPIY